MEKEQAQYGNFNISTGLLVGSVLMAVFLYQSTRRQKGLPPGPPVVPVFGSLPFLGTKNLPQALRKAREKYGDLITVRLFSQDVVVLNSYEVIKDALVNHANAFSGRPPVPFIDKVSAGLISSNGNLWQEQRKFAHGVLRHFGVGRNLLEEKILEELDFILEKLQMYAKTGPVDLSNLLHNGVSNIMCSIAFGKRFEHGDPHFQLMMKSLERLIDNSAIIYRFGNIHFLQYLPGDMFGIKTRIEEIHRFADIFKQEIKEHQSSRTAGHIRDYIDAYLDQMEKEKDNEESTFCEKQLAMSLVSLFIAGTETTATTLKWAVLYLLHNPEMQTRIHNEIQDILEDHTPSMKDKINLPLTEAVILECQRMGDIVPLAIPHKTTEDVNFRGYFIPKDTRILVNLHSAHYDSQLWKDPFKFDPTRFFDSDGKVDKNEHLVPFSMGKRVCLGESMARMELFLFFTGIMQHFSFKLPPDHTLPPLEGYKSIVNVPPSFEVTVVPHV